MKKRKKRKKKSSQWETDKLEKILYENSLAFNEFLPSAKHCAWYFLPSLSFLVCKMRLIFTIPGNV